jgi:rhamnogalacturonyl hydrolase YesR
MLYKIAAIVHKLLKSFFNKKAKKFKGDFFYIYKNGFFTISKNDISKTAYINDEIFSSKYAIVSSANLFFGENAGINIKIEASQSSVIQEDMDFRSGSAFYAWLYCLKNAIIKEGFRNSGFCINGYTFEENQYCLSSWIWTSAAVARCFLEFGDLKRAKIIANAFIREQQQCGAWIVRYDFSENAIVPMLAPNDSAYIAKNCLLSLYIATHEDIYLDCAIKCASWIMQNCRFDGLVSNGFNLAISKWEEEFIIVDTGFTAGLFAALFKITGKIKYRNFLESFIITFVKKFFDKDCFLFATSIDRNGKKLGGYFARGQAWALEGLIPAYEVLGHMHLFELIESCINAIIDKQNKNGSWPYNLSRRYMGEDCKGTSVIALSLIKWYKYSSFKEKILKSCKAALEWCEKHTEMDGPQAGMIFSYSFEGAVVHHPYSSTAFIYATAYALELKKALDEIS